MSPDESNPDLTPYLAATELIETSHLAIQAQTQRLIHGLDTQAEQARALFYFVRDQIQYDFRVKNQFEQYQASAILAARKGFCTQKAILFCTLARCSGIPAGLQFYDIIDHTLPPYIVNLMGSRTLFHHGIAVLWLNHAWRRYDATLHLALVQRNQLVAVEFDPDRDCLMSPKTLAGRQHIEYIRDYGLRAGVTFTEIMTWFHQAYPHLAVKYLPRP